MAESSTTEKKKRGRPSTKVLKMPSPEPENQPPPTPFDPPDPDQPPPSATSPAPAVPVSAKPFPPPPRGEGKGGYCNAEKGMEYWRTLPAEFLNRTNVYVNREWPILDRLQELTPTEQQEVFRRQRRAPTKYIDMPADPFGPDTNMEVLRRYGSGKYKVYVNDAGVRGAKNNPELQPRNLCKFWLSVHDSAFPPVLDPSRPDQGLGVLDLKHPENQSFITELRLRGVLPNAANEEDMAATQIVTDLAGRVQSLATEVAKGKEETLATRLIEEIRANKPAADTGLGKVIDLLMLMITKQQTPAADANAPMIAMFQTQLASVQAELREERAERRKYEEAARQRANQPPPDPFDHFERVVATFDKARTFFDGKGAGTAGAIVKHASRMNGTLEFLAEIVPKIAEAPILNALAQRIMAGTPPPALNPGTLRPGVAPVPAAPGAAAAPAAPSTDAELFAFVQSTVTPAMMTYLSEESSGDDFASWVYAGFPNRLKELQARGPQQIIFLYKQSPLWVHLAAKEAMFTQFVTDFCAWQPDAGPDSDEDPATVDRRDPSNPPPPVKTAAAPNANGKVPIDLDGPTWSPSGGMPLEGESIIDGGPPL